jgi:chemotaxis protein MotA
VVDAAAMTATLVALATRARRDGLVAIERDAEDLDHEFLKRSLALAIDGTDPKVLRATLEAELDRFDEDGEAPAEVFEAAGGYAPTVGILGAVLGLIHVMENLSDPSKLGSGIAVAFVATVYGVGLANLVLLPMAGKLRRRHRDAMIGKELVVEGTCALADGENPRLIERKLRVYGGERIAGKKPEEARARAALRTAA